VLAIEDSESDARLLDMWLSGFVTTRCDLEVQPSLRRALHDIAENQPDVVLLDLSLIDSDTQSTIEALPKLAQFAPVVVITGYADELIGFRALRAGAVEFLDKSSLDPETLEQVVLRALVARGGPTRTFGAISDPIVVVGADRRVCYANTAAAKVLGRRLDELTGQPFGFPVSGAGAREIVVDGRAGRRVVELRVSGAEWDGEPAYVVMLFDRTEQRRAQELERRLMHSDRLAAVGTLAAALAHEINNPLAAVVTNLETARLLLGDVGVLPPQETLDELSAIVVETAECADRIATIVRDLRGFARADHDLSPEPVSVREIVEAACRLVMPEIKRRARLELELDDSPVLVLDVAKLGQVLVNLLMNACQAMPDDKAPEQNLIRVSVRPEGGDWIISVKDTGQGIDEETQSRIFEPFFTTKPREVGTGLGLALARTIMERHGGALRVQSTPGEGSCFEIVLPAEGLRPSTPVVPVVVPRTEADHHCRVLLVDDDVPVRRAYERLLSGQHQVSAVSSGAEALALIDQGQEFDVVLCDMLMPAMDGITLLKELRNRSPELAQRTVFITGAAPGMEVTEAVRVLRKPVASHELLATVREVASGR
jgi:signal transduction histidine kinase